MSPFYTKDGVYRSPRPPISLPQDPNISLVPFLFRNLQSCTQSTALIDAETGQSLTFSDLKTQVSDLSNALLNLNISNNDVVLIYSPNSILFPVSFLSVLAIGAIATIANPHFNTSELSHQVENSKPKLIITVHELYDKIKHLNLPCVLLSPKREAQKNNSFNSPIWFYSDLTNSSNKSPSELPLVVQSDVAVIQYSSGTTEISKGVVLTHRNFIATALMLTSDYETSHADARNVVLCALPLFHMFGLSGIICAQLQKGNAVVIMEGYEVEKVLGAIEKYGVTHLFAVTPVVTALAKQHDAVKYGVSCLKEIVTGAAPLGKEVVAECVKKFPGAVIFQGYGMTETCGIISMNSRTGSEHAGSAGVLVPGVESQIIHVNTRQPLPPFQKGEIWVRGPNVMQGYYRNPKATAEALDEQGWVHTGDLGYFDDEGRIYIAGRLKELIKCNGFQVSPTELEELLLTHPEIADAAVIPFPDAKAYEVPIATIVRSSGSSFSEEDVLLFISGKVPPFKRLHTVRFVDSIPRSALGKILRGELIVSREL